MILGDLGAEIIKIETPFGDPTRYIPGPAFHNESYAFLSLNRNKKSIILDLGTPFGKDAFYELVRISDVVWDNFRPGVMERLEADYEHISVINPRIISCSITGFGSNGPSYEKPLHDTAAFGLSGLLSVSGEPGGKPVKPGPPFGDAMTGMFAAIATLAAVINREQTGKGTKVGVSLLDSCVAMLVHYMTYYFLGGVVPGPQAGSGNLFSPGMGIYPTREGYIALGVSWPRIARVLGAEWLMEDPRFSSLETRAKNRAELYDELSKLFLKEKAEDWLRILSAEDISAGPVNTIDQVVQDPQVLHNHMVLSLRYPSGDEIKTAGNPVKAEEIDESKYLTPPVLGQNDYEVLANMLGYSEEKIKELREQENAHAGELKAHLERLK